MRRVWPLRFDISLSINAQGTLRRLHAANSTRPPLAGFFTPVWAKERKVKLSTYPPFMVHCKCDIQLPENKSTRPDISINLSFYIQHWNDINPGAKSEAVFRLTQLGVNPETLKDAYFEVDDMTYVAIEPRGVKREYGVWVEAFYHHDSKKRATLIKQRRLVPDSYDHMVEMYGKPATKAKATEASKGVPA